MYDSLQILQKYPHKQTNTTIYTINDIFHITKYFEKLLIYRLSTS